jgi:outer membrane protein assembly factor BamB
MKKIGHVIIAMVVLGILPTSSFAKRLPPPAVEPISRNSVIYSEYGEDSILATDKKTGEQIWKRQIYVVKHMPGLEPDVQACFITKISLKDNKLIVTNEEGYRYELNIDTLEVKVLKGAMVIDRTNEA